MGRTATKPEAPAQLPALRVEAEQAVILAQQAASEDVQRAMTLATELGYQGPLSAGALEDEIRFYQRRSVEALLECGKRLLLLKEVTPHGEFTQRVEMLGFSAPTARRFMQAASKTAKSLNLSVLSTQVKSASAFLELVTHDDDVLENLQELDDIDRMSASQLRNALRQSEQDVKFANEKRAKAEEHADQLEKKAQGSRPKVIPLSTRITPFQLEITERQSLIEKAVTAHMESIEALDAWCTEEASQAPDYDPTVVVPLPREVLLVAQHLEDAINRVAQMVARAQNEFQLRFGADMDEARQYLLSSPEAANG